MAHELRYDRMVESALRGVVRAALTEAAEHGLPGNHHFYVTFRTSHPGVQLADHLRARYAGEMTIVLQYQYFGLEVEEDLFCVTLSFSGQHERLVIPYAAITTFADPSVNFALQFQPLAQAEDQPEQAPAARRPTLKAVKPGDEAQEQAPRPAPAAKPAEAKAADAKTTDEEGDAPAPAEEPRGQVVALDAFRKK
ncbi:MAG TPA: ClpXP protease specificity-enhancing factor SspB [Azospirillaceae bacterium]|nr:ClpXP protease specificity-enhancing factor SspB [Azospirillaceae bacterium]HRQ81151.1 ClpXP protease specificity-enhancing factor SspB [Azospirillaceae bacterium]